MSDPVLQREAEVPRTRSTGGAIVVAVAFFSLFTALGASAFVIRVRSLAAHGCPAERARRQAAAPEVAAAQALQLLPETWSNMPLTVTAEPADGTPVPVELLSQAE